MNYRIVSLTVFGWLLLNSTIGHCASVKFTLSGRVRPGNFSGGYGQFSVSAELNGQIARIENDCIDDQYCDPLFDNCCGGQCSIPTAVSQITSLNCGQAYMLSVVGQSCDTGVTIAFAQIDGITAANTGYIFEITDNQTGTTSDKFNVSGITIGSGQTKTWTVTLKPKQVLFERDTGISDGKSLIQARLSFANGAGHWFTGAPVWSIAPGGGPLGCTIDSTGLIRVGTEDGEITVVATDGTTSRKATGVLRLGCTACGSSCGPGQGRVANKADALSVALGEGGCARGWIGSIRLKLTAPNANLTTPAGLVFDSVTPEVIRDIGRSGLNQIKAPQCFVDVVTTANPNPEYDIKVYWPENSGSKGGGLYQPPASPGPIKVWRVTRLASDNTQFTITEDPTAVLPNGANIVNTFTWIYQSPTENGWALNRNGLSQEKRIVQIGIPVVYSDRESARHSETIEISTPGNVNIPSRTIKTYATLSLNGQDVLVKELREGLKADGSSSANIEEWTTYNYAATVTSDGHAKLERVKRSDGSWEHYEYDGNGRISAVYTPWLDFGPPNNPDTTPSTVPNRKTTYDYTPPAGDTRPDDTATPRKIVTYLDTTGGNPQPPAIALSYVVLTTDTQTYPTVDVRQDIACSSPTALPGDSPRLVTTTRTYAGGAFKGSLRSIQRPDGTRTVYAYTPTTVQVSEGAPGAAVDTVSDGKRTTTEKTARGVVLNTTVVNISPVPSANGKVLLQDVWSGSPDAQGRYPTLTHLDGTTETYIYDCCNTTQVVGRDGETTVFTPDALKRIWRTTRYYSTALQNGIETRDTLDAVGNITKTTRIGTDGTSSFDPVPLREYDRAGRMFHEQNALLGDTFITEGNTGYAGRMVTTTYPDGGTRIEEYYLDGRLKKIRGTAAQPVQYDYGFDTTAGQLFVTETKLNAAESPTGEWTKTFTDFLGRDYKTVYPDAAYSQRFYKDNGQLWKERDPDTVLTVYIYNTRGEVEYTMVGLKNDPATPPTVPDTTGEHRITRVENSVSAYTDVSPYDTLMTRVTEWTVANFDNKIITSETHTSITPPPIGQMVTREWNVGYPNDTFKQAVRTVTQYGSGGTRTVTATYPDNSSQISLFSYGRVSSVARYGSDGGPVAATTFQYDKFGLLWKSTDARNGATTFSYNNADQVTSVVSPVPAPGQPAQTRRTDYDKLARATQVTEPDGGLVYTRYYKNGLVKLTWGARTYPTGYEYDAQGRITKLYTWRSFVAPDPSNTDPPFPAGAVATTWDYHPQRGWLKDKRYADTKGPDYEYTAGGRLRTRSWWRSVPVSGSPRLKTTYTYDFDLDPTAVTRRAGYLAKIDYNDSGVPDGEVSTPGLTFDYDRRGRGRTVTQGTGPASIRTELGWQPAGALDSETYYGSFLDTLSVNAVNVDLNNLLRRASLEARKSGTFITGTSVTYGYDTLSRLQTVTSAGFSATYGYVPNSFLVGTVRFNQGSTKRLSSSSDYDGLNRLRSISPVASADGQALLFRNYGYNSANQRTTRTDGDWSYWVYGYEPKEGQLNSAKHHWDGGAVVPGQQFEYTYDDIGNRLTSSEGGDAAGSGLRQTTYVPNDLNQYTSRSMNVADRKIDVMGLAQVPTTVTINGVAPDYRLGEYFWKTVAGSGAGPNWLGVTVVDGATTISGSVYLPPQSETFGPDADGNLIGDARWAYKWDAENRLVRVETKVSAAAAGIPPRQVQYTYDYQGRLIHRKVYSGIYSGGTITPWTPDTTAGSDLLFLYDGMQCIAALNAADQTLYQAYVWGLDLSGSPGGASGVGGLVMFRRTVGATTETYFPAYDGNGNLTALANGNDGTVAARYDYSPFGQLLRLSGGSVALDNPWRFSTKYQDDQTDLVYYGYRWYSPATGRWPNRDPIGERGGLNLYGFVYNSPVNKIDPLGQNAADLALKIAGKQIPKAFGLNAGGIIVVKVPWLRGLIAGGATSVMFFPDSCEVAGFSVRAGLGNTLADWRAATADDFGKWREAGLLASIGVGIEAAGYVGNTTPGSANAASFLGLFHTLQVGFTAEGVPIGASVYFGDKDATGGRWIGGTLGVGPGVGLAVIDWNYQFMIGPVTVKPKCLCYAAILAMP